MKGHEIIERIQSGIYDIPAYLRKGVILQPNPSDAVVHQLDQKDAPEEPEKPENPPAVDIPPQVPKPEEGDKNTQEPPKKPKRRRSTISLPKKSYVPIHFVKHQKFTWKRS